MDRNKVIFGFARALVVIEAGERGGTLAASEGALSAGRPLLVLDFGTETPSGNQKLLSAGGRAIESTGDLVAVLDELANAEEQAPDSLF